MAHRRFTAEETANLVMNDQVDDLFGKSIAAIESDATDDDDVDPYQPVLPDSDSDEDFTSDLDDDLRNDNGDDETEEDSDVEEDDPDNFFYSKDKSVKWMKRAPGQRAVLMLRTLLTRWDLHPLFLNIYNHHWKHSR